MKTDIEIAQEAKMKPITQIAAQLGLEEESVIPYGRYKAKIDHRLIHNAKKQGKLILVTAISPTPAGEGKTTTSVGLADAMNALGKKTMLCLREPSLGPVFGVKGGAAGGGYAQVVPMEDINLHFTGDLHAIGTANNLLAAMIDNSIQQGNPLNIDPRRITWKRCMDMNDRQLRFIVDGLGGKGHQVPIIGHNIHHTTVIGLQIDDLTLFSDLQIGGPFNKWVGNDGVRGIVENVNAGQSHSVIYEAVSVSIEHRNTAGTKNKILQAVTGPCFGQGPPDHRHGLKEQILSEIIGQAATLCVHHGGSHR